MAETVSAETSIVGKMKRWLEVEFPDMVWENDALRPDYIVAQRVGIDGSNEYFHVAVTPTFCWANGKPHWPAPTYQATPSNAYSANFWHLVQDVKVLRYLYDEDVRYARSKMTLASAKSKKKTKSHCAVQ